METSTGRIIINIAAYTKKKDEANAERYTGSTEKRNNMKEASSKKFTGDHSVSVSDSRNWSSEPHKPLLHNVDYR